MFKKTRMIGLLLVFVFVASAVGFIEIKQMKFPLVEAQATAPTLSIEVSTSQNNYIQLEPIPFYFKLSNRTNNPVSWRGNPMLGHDIKLLVRREGEQEVRWDGQGMGLFGTGFSVMQPGKDVQNKDILNSVPMINEVFPRLGRYEVRAEFRYDKTPEKGQKEIILSTPIVINIPEPTGIDLQAHNYITDVLEPAKYRERASGEMQRLDQDFLDKYRDSVYAKYISWELAWLYKYDGEEEKAQRELCKLYGVNFYYSREVLRSIWEINAKLRPTVLKPLSETDPVPLFRHPCTNKLVDSTLEKPFNE